MSINKVILVGNVGKEPEIRYLDNNVPVATITLATSDRAYKTANGTEIPERTEWHTIKLWRGLAEVAEKYVHKGSQLYIEGKLRSRNWTDQNGLKRYETEIQADNMELLGRRSDNQNIGSSNRPSMPAASEPIKSVAESPFDSKEESSADDLPF